MGCISFNPDLFENGLLHCISEELIWAQFICSIDIGGCHFATYINYRQTNNYTNDYLSSVIIDNKMKKKIKKYHTVGTIQKSKI
jgi:hypothetical protein